MLFSPDTSCWHTLACSAYKRHLTEGIFLRGSRYHGVRQQNHREGSRDVPRSDPCPGCWPPWQKCSAPACAWQPCLLRTVSPSCTAKLFLTNLQLCCAVKRHSDASTPSDPERPHALSSYMISFPCIYAVALRHQDFTNPSTPYSLACRPTLTCTPTA